MKGFISCYQGKWYRVHCDPIPEPPIEPGRDAAIDASDAADVPQALDGKPLDTASIDTGPVDTGSAIDSDGRLRGYLAFANEVIPNRARAYFRSFFSSSSYAWPSFWASSVAAFCFSGEPVCRSG